MFCLSGGDGFFGVFFNDVVIIKCLVYQLIIQLPHTYVSVACNRLYYISEEISIPENGAFIMCDFGSADGGSSRDLITEVISKWYFTTLLDHVLG